MNNVFFSVLLIWWTHTVTEPWYPHL